MLKRLLAAARQPRPAVAPDASGSAAAVAVICATRLPEDAFWTATHLGKTLPLAMRAAAGRMAAHIAYENRAGLADVYNAALAALPDSTIAVLVHDDVSLYDYQLAARLDDALAQFDLIGVAGNAAPAPDHVGWYYRRTPGGPLVPHDDACLSGAVDHLHQSGEHFLSVFGPAPRAVQLLDGLFIAFRVGALRAHAIRLDAQFRFHFYDLDLCRQCSAAGLRLGTWPLALGHAGMGRFESPEWELALQAYRAKWA